MSDPWATTQTPAASPETASDLAGQAYPDGDEGSSLFGGAKVRSLFNKHIKQGTPRVGVIALPPVDRQSYDFEGKPKFWDPTTKSVVTTDTGRPMKDTVIVVDTAYRFTQDEIDDLTMKIDPTEVSEDTGRRSLRLNGELKKAMISAIRANGIRSDAELVGWEITIDRGRKVPIAGNKTQWQGGTVTLRKP